MNIYRLGFLCTCAALAIGVAAPSNASQTPATVGQSSADSVPAAQGQLCQAIANLEDAVAELTAEFNSPVTVGEEPTLAKEDHRAPLPLADVSDSSKPWSMQYRVIVTPVTFYRLNVIHDNSPELWYSQGSFVDPNDGKTYAFLLDDMGALAAGHTGTIACVVTYRPAQRQLSESDIASIVPIDWINKEVSGK